MPRISTDFRSIRRQSNAIIERCEHPVDVSFAQSVSSSCSMNVTNFANTSVLDIVPPSMAVYSNAGLCSTSVVNCSNSWDGDAAFRQSPEISLEGQLVYTPRRTPISGAALVDGSQRMSIYNAAQQHCRHLLVESNPSVGSDVAMGYVSVAGGMVRDHVGVGPRDSSMACVRAQDIARSDPSFAMSAAPVEGPQSVNGLQWVGQTTDHLRQMGGPRPVVCPDPGVQYISASIHHQSPGAGTSGFASPVSVYQAPLHATVANNLCADSMCNTVYADSDGVLRSTPQVTVRQSMPPLFRSKVALVGDSANVASTFSPANVYSVPVEVHTVLHHL